MNNEKVFLHISYYDNGEMFHRYYIGDFDILRLELEEVCSSEDTTNMDFEFRSKPFAGIEVSRYVELP